MAHLADPKHPAEDQEARDGEESKGGAIRADTQGIRVRRRDRARHRAQAGSASPDGTTGAGQCRTAGAPAVGTEATDNGAVDALHRRGPGSRSQRPAQAASHRPSHLAADYDGAAGEESVGSDDPAVCARAQTGAGMVSTRDLCAAELRTWTGRPG